MENMEAKICIFCCGQLEPNMKLEKNVKNVKNILNGEEKYVIIIL